MKYHQPILRLSLPHSQSTSYTTTKLHPFTLSTTRYIHSSIGYNTNEAYCQSHAIQQKIHPCHLPKFTEVYAPPEINCNFHPTIIESWNTYPLESTAPIAVYTDGSLIPEEQQTTLTSHTPPTKVTSAVVFYEKTTQSTSWCNRKVIAIQIRLPTNTNSTNYTAEVLAATVATSLPGLKETHIYTDALGLISSLTKTTKLNTLSPLSSPPLLHRDYTDTGILYKHLVQHYPHTTYSHVKAHQEDQTNAIPTEHGTGNKLADLIAQNKLNDARKIAPNIKIFTYTLEELFTNTTNTPIIQLGDSPATPTFYIHHPKITEQRFHTISLNSWLNNVIPYTSLSPLQWTDISWNLAGTLISKATANCTHMKTFLLKFLYNALPNMYNKHKYSTQKQGTDSQQDDFPPCPLCNQGADSLSHLYCQCPHPEITQHRTNLLTNLKKICLNTNPLTNDNTTLLTIANLITERMNNTSPDHRCLLGLVPAQQLPLQKTFKQITKNYQLIVQQTVPFISTIWKAYCTISHTNTIPTNTRNTTSNTIPLPRLTIITGNNGTISTQTITDHQPPAYFRKKRKSKRYQPLHDPTQRTLSIHYLQTQNTPPLQVRNNTEPTTHHTTYSQCDPLTPIVSEQWQSPSNPARRILAVPTHSHPPTQDNNYHNNFSPLEITDNPNPIDNINLPTYPHQTFNHINISLPTTRTNLLNHLNMTLTDVPANGDCFYNVIQLFLTSIPDPIQTHIPQLRQQIATFFKSSSGKTILQHYHQQPTIIEQSILPTLKPSLFPNRDIFAQDFVIAAMASILQTTINVYQNIPSQPPLHITFKPYPTHHSLHITTTHLPYIHIWNENSHFQLMTPKNYQSQIHLPLLSPPPPNLPVLNKTPKGRLSTIPAPRQFHTISQCIYHPLPSDALHPTSFCTQLCHQHCPNHYSAYRPVPIKIAHFHQFSAAVNAVGVPKHTPLFETAGTISKKPTENSIPITPHHHTSILYSHPLVKLITHSTNPNCILRPLIIPEPFPHIKLFVVTLTDLNPYTVLSIHPPPRPLPPPQPPPEPPPQPTKAPPSRTHPRITDYFKSLR